jgi:hypothetical protein
MDWKRVRTCATSLALASLSLWGASRTFAVDNNSTRIGPYKEWHLEDIYMGDGFQTNGHTAVGMTYGLGPDKSTLFGRTEVGFDYVLSAGPYSGVSIPSGTSPEGNNGSLPGLFSGPTLTPAQRTFWGAKTQLYEDPKTMTRLVIGGYLWGPHEANAGDLGFLAISRQTKKDGYFHLGVVHSFAGTQAIKTRAGHSDHWFGQIDYAYQLKPRLVGGFNCYTGRSTESAIFPAIIYFISDDYNSSVTLGDFHFWDKSVRPDADQTYVQFDYYFNGPSHVRRPWPPAAPPAPKAPEPAPSATPPAPPANTTPPTVPTTTTAPVAPAPSGAGGAQ